MPFPGQGFAMPVRTSLLCPENWLLPESSCNIFLSTGKALIALAVSFFIISAFSSSRDIGVAQGEGSQYSLGRFFPTSVYLYHVVILLSLLHSLYWKSPLGVIWLGTAVLTLAVPFSVQVI